MHVIDSKAISISALTKIILNNKKVIQLADHRIIVDKTRGGLSR